MKYFQVSDWEMLTQRGSRAMGGEDFGECIREESSASQDRTGYAAVTNVYLCLCLHTTSLFLVFTMCSVDVSKRAVVTGATLLPRPVEGLSQHKLACQQREGSEGNHAQPCKILPGIDTYHFLSNSLAKSNSHGYT